MGQRGAPYYFAKIYNFYDILIVYKISSYVFIMVILNVYKLYNVYFISLFVGVSLCVRKWK